MLETLYWCLLPLFAENIENDDILSCLPCLISSLLKDIFCVEEQELSEYYSRPVYSDSQLQKSGDFRERAVEDCSSIGLQTKTYASFSKQDALEILNWFNTLLCIENYLITHSLADSLNCWSDWN